MPATLFQIRPATDEDQAAIRRLIYSARLNPLGLSWHAFSIMETPEGEVLGCGQVKVHQDGSRELASLYILPGHRGQGLAGALIRHLMANARSDLWLTCREGLVPFYRRFGFIPIDDPGVMPRYFRVAWWLFGIFHRFVGRGERLAVMYWEDAGNA